MLAGDDYVAAAMSRRLGGELASGFLTDSSHARARSERERVRERERVVETDLVLALRDPAARRILVVDDDPNIQEVLTTLLESAGYTASAAGNAAAVQAALSGQQAEVVLLDLQLTPDKVAGKKFYRGRGCEACNNSGYRGRRGLFELMIMNDELRDMIMRSASTDELRTAAQGYGMVTLRDAGMIAIFAGDTTVDEVLRETIIEG